MRRIILIAVALVLGLALNGFAKEKPKATAPVPDAVAEAQKQEIKTIFSYKAELGLTDKQEADIRKLLIDLQNTFTEKAKKLNTLRQELAQMIKDRANLRTIRRKIEEIGKIQVENTYLDIESSRKIENTLTPEQLKKWQDIQKETREKMQAVAKAKSAASAAKPKK